MDCDHRAESALHTSRHFRHPRGGRSCLQCRCPEIFRSRRLPESSIMKPNPLPRNPTWIERVEHALQCVFCWMIIEPKNHPMISGLATGILMMILIFATELLLSIVALV